MNVQVKQQIVRFVRLSVFGALALSPQGQAVARDLHNLAVDAHVLFITPGAAGVVLVAFAENVARSIVPVTSAGAKVAAKKGTAARLLAWAATKFLGATIPPAA